MEASTVVVLLSMTFDDARKEQFGLWNTVTYKQFNMVKCISCNSLYSSCLSSLQNRCRIFIGISLMSN